MSVDTVGHEVARVGNGGEVLLLVVLDSNNIRALAGWRHDLYLGGSQRSIQAPTSTTHGADADVA